MAKLNATLSKHIGAAVIALHVVLLPMLFFAVDWTVRAAQQDNFVNHVRTYTKMLSEEIETGVISTGDAGLVSILDSLALGGEVTFAEIVIGDRVLRSSLLPQSGYVFPSAEDYSFGQGDDQVYFVSGRLLTEGQQAILRLGFDEQPTIDSITSTRRGVLITLVCYFAAVTIAALLYSYALARPMRQLRLESRRIASGNFSQHLFVRSSVRDLNDLASDLETMRETLVSTNLQLAKQIAERGVLEAQLRQKQRLETVGTLAGGVAHEFNNVLVPITLFTETALDALAEDHPAHSDLLRVLSAARRAQDIVGKILAFGRQFKSQTAGAVSIAAAVEEGLRLFEALRPANIEVLSEIGANCPEVVADPTLIVQVVMNLCTNAYQAMLAHGGTMRVSLREANVAPGNNAGLAAGRYLELAVSDTGHGMDEATRERVFEPFFTTREVGQGTGLGLSVVHGIASTLGAVIQVDSAPGEGSTFRLLIPCLTPGPGQ